MNQVWLHRGTLNRNVDFSYKKLPPLSERIYCGTHYLYLFHAYAKHLQHFLSAGVCMEDTHSTARKQYLPFLCLVFLQENYLEPVDEAMMQSGIPCSASHSRLVKDDK